MDDRAELIRRPGKYRKKPVVIEAALFDGKIVGVPDGRGGVIPSTCPTWFPAVVKNVAYGEGVLCKPGETIFVDDHLHVGTLEGTMVVSPGDWVIRGVKGEIYPCKPDIFTATYEAADALEAAPAVPGGGGWNRRAPAQSINAEMLEALKTILFEDSDKPEIDRIADRTRAAAIIDRAEAATDAGGDA